MYDGIKWTNFTKNEISNLRYDDFRAVAVDHQNNKWFGSWGGGLVKFSTDSTWTVYDGVSGHLTITKNRGAMRPYGIKEFRSGDFIWVKRNIN